MFSDSPGSEPHAPVVKQIAAIEAWLAPLFAKAPHLPPNIRQSLVDIVPWLALIGGVLGIAGILSAGMFTSMLFSFSFMMGGMMSTVYAIGMLLGLVSAVLYLLAYQPLSQRKKTGWNYLFYALLLSVVSFVLNLIAGYGMAGQVLGLLLGLWLLFEIRDAYKA